MFLLSFCCSNSLQTGNHTKPHHLFKVKYSTVIKRKCCFFYGCFMSIQQFWTEKQIMSKLSIESFKPNCENKYSEWKICCGAHIFKGNRKGGSNNVHMVVIKLWRKSWQTEKTKAREAMTGHFTEANLWVHINFKLVSWLMISEVRPCLA